MNVMSVLTSGCLQSNLVEGIQCNLIQFISRVQLIHLHASTEGGGRESICYDISRSGEEGKEGGREKDSICRRKQVIYG